jgi:hypothetical protein
MVSSQQLDISLMNGRSGTKDYGSLRDVESCFYTKHLVRDKGLYRSYNWSEVMILKLVREYTDVF